MHLCMPKKKNLVEDDNCNLIEVIIYAHTTEEATIDAKSPTSIILLEKRMMYDANFFEWEEASAIVLNRRKCHKHQCYLGQSA